MFSTCDYHVYELLCSYMEEVRLELNFESTLGREQEVGHSQFMVSIVTLNLKLAYLGWTNVSLPNTHTCTVRLYINKR